MKLAGRTERLAASLVREILAVANRPEVISFAGGLPARDVMPAPDFRDMPAEVHQYGPSEGEWALREAIATRLTREGLTVAPDQILITTGSQQGIDLVSKLFIDEGAPVAIESPTYLAALQSFSLFGARYRELAMDAEGVKPGAVTAAAGEETPRFAYLIPDFQNPSACCYTRQRREAVAAELAEQGIPLVEDAPYRDLMYDDVDRTPIASLLPEGHPWIYFGSFSKVAVPSLRVGFIACSPELHPYLLRLKQAADLHTNRPAQWWLARFLEDGRLDGHLERLNAFYRERRDAMAEALTRHFGDGLAWSLPAGGLFFWGQLAAEVDTFSLLEPALAQHVAFMPGRPFFADAPAQNCMRLNFSHATPERIDEGVKRLAALVDGG